MEEIKELKIGDAIELNDDQFAIFDEYRKRHNRALLILESIAFQMESNQEDFWKTAKEMFPETEPFVCQFDSATRKIRMMRGK